MECNLGSEKACVLIANGKARAGYNPSVNDGDTFSCRRREYPQGEHEEEDEVEEGAFMLRRG